MQVDDLDLYLKCLLYDIFIPCFGVFSINETFLINLFDFAMKKVMQVPLGFRSIVNKRQPT